MPTIVAYVHAYVPDHNAGAETTMHDLLKYLVADGWEAHVVIKHHGHVKANEYVIDGVNVHQSEDKRTLLHWLPKADATISHLECSERTHLLSNAYSIPSVHLVHNTHPLTVKWMQSADAAIFNTHWVSLDEQMKQFTKPSTILYPPVKPEEYKTARGKKVTLVNLWEDKGAEIFYEMAKRMPRVEFLGVKGGYGVQEIRDLPNVTISEHTSDMKKIYGETKVLLMPSKYESFGRVGVEAMASGIPVLAEPTRGLQESLASAGTFADRNNPDEWEEKLTNLLKPVVYGKMSKLAKERSTTLEKLRGHQLSGTKAFLHELIRIGKL